MGEVIKYFSLILIAILVFSSLIIIKSAYAQTTPKPIVPEFTLEVVRSSYEHPAVYSIDPYTGENVTIVQARVDYVTEIVITIKNQLFASYKDSNGNWIELFYNIQSKGHFSHSWNTISNMYDIGPLKQSDTGFTTQSYWANSTPANAQIDFRAQAMIGFYHDVYTGQTLNGYSPVFVGENSAWSSIQTLNITDSSTIISETEPSSSPASPSHNPTETPQQPKIKTGVLFGLNWEQIAIILLGITVIFLMITLILSSRRSAKQTSNVVNASFPQALLTLLLLYRS